jgi:hypothetical protein
MTAELTKGNEVILRDDPGRRGMLTGKTTTIGNTAHYQVFWGGGRATSWHPVYELIAADDEADVFELIRSGRFGSEVDFNRLLTHMQLKGRLSDLIYSMDTTRTEFFAYQFKPVLSFLESPSKGLLIADEVGLGKTIEAGLIWTELRARLDARRLLVVCPAMLREKWKIELYRRFGVEAAIVDATRLRKELAREKNDVPQGRGLICSIQGIRPSGNDPHHDERARPNARYELTQFLQERSDDVPMIDLTIIDEAHYMRNPGTSSARLGQMLRDVSESIVLLSATPINLRDDDLFHLLKLVDPESFSSINDFPRVLEANRPLQEARDLSLNPESSPEEIVSKLAEARSFDLLSNSRQLQGLVNGGVTHELLDTEAGRVRLANSIERINLLRHSVNRTRKVEVVENTVIRDPYTEFVQLTFAEQNFYDAVTNAIREYAVGRNIVAGFLLAAPQRQVSSCMFAAAKAWQKRACEDQTGAQWVEEMIYEDFGEEPDILDIEEASAPLIAHLIDRVLPQVDLAELRNNDSKYQRFRDNVKDYLKDNPKEKIVLFSFFRGTLDYLAERLSEDGIHSQVLKGGMTESKQEIIDRFRESKTTRLLLSSEVASEGVDLQFCRLIVNYDLPWNPMKIEQRIGRLDRIGQHADKIKIWNLCYEGTIDNRIYHRLLERLNIFVRALGGLDVMLGQEISRLTHELLSQVLTPKEEEERITNTAIAIENLSLAQEQLEEKASHLIAHGGYVLDKVNSAHEQKRTVTSGDLFFYTRDYLQEQTAGSKFQRLKTDEYIVDIQLSPDVAAGLELYVQRNKLFGKTRLPSGDNVRCEFANKVYHESSRIELINQYHPLVRYIGGEMNADTSCAKLVAMQLDGRHTTLQSGYYAFSGLRWQFEGLRQEEELQFRISPVDDMGDLVEGEESKDAIQSVRRFGERWLEASSLLQDFDIEAAVKRCLAALEEDYQNEKDRKRNENFDRVSFQVASAESHMNRQLQMLEEVLHGHRENQRDALIAATEGRIKKVRERFNMHLEKLNQNKESFRAEREGVVSGVLQIN